MFSGRVYCRDDGEANGDLAPAAAAAAVASIETIRAEEFVDLEQAQSQAHRAEASRITDIKGHRSSKA